MPEKQDRFLRRARDVYDSTAERLSDAKDKTKETIQEHPFTSVIVAAAIGAIAGVATAEIVRAIRRSRKR